MLRIREWLLALALAAGLASPAVAGQWLKAESAHFIIYTDTGQKSARDYDRMLEDFDATLRVVYGRPLDEPVSAKLKVYLVGNAKDFRRAVPEATTDMVGVYVADERDTFVVAQRGEMKDSKGYGDDTVLHEYAHHFMGQYAAMAYPSWYVEGFAEYFSTTDLGDKTIVIGRISPGRAYQLSRMPWIPAARLLGESPSEMRNETERGAYYAEGWMLTHIIMDSEPRRKAFNRYVELSRAGQAPLAAWRTAFGQSFDDLDAMLHAYMTKPLLGLNISRGWSPAPVTISEVPPGEGEVLLETVMLKQQSEKVDRASLFNSLRAAAARYPKDPAVKLALAKAEIAYGKPEAGESMLREMLAVNGQDAEALLALSWRLLKTETDDAARKKAIQLEANSLLARAVRANADSYQALYAYALNRTFEPDFPTDNTMNAMLKASSLAPQVGVIRLNAGQAALWRKDYALARSLIEPVAGNPHHPELGKAAKELLDTIPKAAVTPPAAAASPARPGS